MKPTVKWLAAPKDSNYPAAASYLALIYPPSVVENIVQRLREAKVVTFKAKDIFRASRLSLLGISNEYVKEFRRKIKHGKPLSPLLLVSNEDLAKVEIADGYHRMCAVYYYHEDADIPVKITSFSGRV